MTASFVPHWDYAKFRIPLEFFPSFSMYLEEVTGCTWQSIKIKHYGSAATLPGGIIAMWERGHTDYALVEMKGGAINSLHPEQQAHLLRTIGDHDGEFTWVDVNIDDHRPDAPQPDQIHEWTQLNQIRLAHFHGRGYRWSESGSTFHAGDYNRKYLRNYNKHLDENGNHISRWEMKFKDPMYAKQAGHELITAARQGHEAVAAVCASLVIGAIEFYEVGEGKNRDRDRVAPFWQKFLDDLAITPLRLIYSKAKKTFDDKISWLEKQVAKSLAMVEAFWGRTRPVTSSFVGHLIKEGKKLITWEDKQTIENAVNEFKHDNGIIEGPGGKVLLKPRYLVQGWEEERLAREIELAEIREEAQGPPMSRRFGGESPDDRPVPRQNWPYNVRGQVLPSADYEQGVLRF